MRIRACKIPQNAWKVGRCKIFGRPEAHLAFKRVKHFSDDFIIQAQQPPRLCERSFALTGKDDVAGITADDLGVQLLLKPLDLKADS